MTAQSQTFTPEGTSNLRDQLGVLGYDLGSRAIFAPLGGIDGLRERTLDALDILVHSNTS